MKYLLLLLIALPWRAAGQAQPPAAPLAAAAPDSSAGWELRLDGESRTTYLGREYGYRTPCLNPQVSYAAPNGLYGRLEGLFFGPAQPNYVYTSLELGYANDLTDHWSYSLSASRTFYTERVTKQDSVLRNDLEAYAQYDLGPVALAVDYNLLFDHFYAHTLGLGVSVPLEKAHWLGFDKVSCAPAAELDWGSVLALRRFGALDAPAPLPPAPRMARPGRPGQQLVPLAYDFALPLEVRRGWITLGVAGHLLVPLRVRGEAPAPPALGYWSAGLALRLPAKPAD